MTGRWDLAAANNAPDTQRTAASTAERTKAANRWGGQDPRELSDHQLIQFHQQATQAANKAAGTPQAQAHKIDVANAEAEAAHRKLPLLAPHAGPSPTAAIATPAEKPTVYDWKWKAKDLFDRLKQSFHDTVNSVLGRTPKTRGQLRGMAIGNRNFSDKIFKVTAGDLKQKSAPELKQLRDSLHHGAVAAARDKDKTIARGFIKQRRAVDKELSSRS